MGELIVHIDVRPVVDGRMASGQDRAGDSRGARAQRASHRTARQHDQGVLLRAAAQVPGGNEFIGIVLVSGVVPLIARLDPTESRIGHENTRGAVPPDIDAHAVGLAALDRFDPLAHILAAVVAQPAQKAVARPQWGPGQNPEPFAVGLLYGSHPSPAGVPAPAEGDPFGLQHSEDNGEEPLHIILRHRLTFGDAPEGSGRIVGPVFGHRSRLRGDRQGQGSSGRHVLVLEERGVPGGPPVTVDGDAHASGQSARPALVRAALTPRKDLRIVKIHGVEGQG